MLWFLLTLSNALSAKQPDCTSNWGWYRSSLQNIFDRCCKAEIFHIRTFPPPRFIPVSNHWLISKLATYRWPSGLPVRVFIQKLVYSNKKASVSKLKSHNMNNCSDTTHDFWIPTYSVLSAASGSLWFCAPGTAHPFLSPHLEGRFFIRLLCFEIQGFILYKQSCQKI